MSTLLASDLSLRFQRDYRVKISKLFIDVIGYVHSKLKVL